MERLKNILLLLLIPSAALADSGMAYIAAALAVGLSSTPAARTDEWVL
ncbi:MAG: hypothetical protein Q9M89_00610 [Persephonella sp.]|nr:hypothetical protein [Persephonella sp.]